ncbi:phage integrase N-terminal SAM-like domain-containing protein [Desulfobacterota bacterium AH_259_B03_O07]|nr:phage integrase N-terminal SAM-like domain-containing protein [Desulfobacterota bacterium AH_259_B03_O07]
MENALEAFRDHLIREGRSPTTIRKYLKDLRQFSRECGIFQLSDITRERINEWILTLREKNCATGTIANHLWAIKALLKFLEGKGVSVYKFDIRIPVVSTLECPRSLAT